jgi:hypothetical protein
MEMFLDEAVLEEMLCHSSGFICPWHYGWRSVWTSRESGERIGRDCAGLTIWDIVRYA